MITPWSSWFPDILPLVQGCPVPLVQNEIKRAAQQLIGSARAWKVVVDGLTVDAGDPLVYVSPEDRSQELVRIEQVTCGSSVLKPTDVDSMAATEGADWPSMTGAPSAYLHLQPGILTLWPTPSEGASLSIVLSVRPSETATGIPQEIAAMFREDIALGAKARLLGMVGLPWANIDMAVPLLSMFLARIDSAAYRAVTSFGGGRVPSRPTWC